MSSKGSTTHVRPPTAGGVPSHDSGTQLFPVPARASGAAGRWPESTGVSVRGTVGVEAAEQNPAPRALDSAPSLGTATPADTRTDAGAVLSHPPRKPTRGANQPTCVFVLSPAVFPAVPDAGAMNGSVTTTRTDASAPFSPVPNAVSSTQAPAATRPVCAAEVAPSAKAPLLRAFEDGHARASRWWTAQTLTAPISVLAAAARSSKTGTTTVTARRRVRVEPEQPPISLQRLLIWFRSVSPTTRKLSALLVVMAMVGVSGSLLVRKQAGRRSWKHLASGAVTAPAAAARAAPAKQSPAREALAPEPTASAAIAPLGAAPPGDEPPPAEIALHELPRHNRQGERPPAALANPIDHGGSRGLTLARQAVDALLAGDSARALQHYRELSRRAPGHDGYREAVRLLSKDQPLSPPLSRSP